MVTRLNQLKTISFLLAFLSLNAYGQVVQCPCECMNKLDLISGNGFYLLDSIKYFTLDQNSLDFRETTTSVFEYNSDYKRSQTIGFRADPEYAVRTPIYRLRYVYDPDGKKTEYLNDRWDKVAGCWVVSQKTHNKYDGNQSIINQTVFSWDEHSENWTPGSRTDFSSGQKGDQTGSIKKVLDKSTGEWKNVYKNTSTKEDDGLKTISESFSWKENTWQPETRSVNHYNAQGYLDETHYYKWNEIEQSWFQMRYMKYIRDQNGRKLEWISTGKDRPEDDETLHGHQVYQYNYDGLLTEVLHIQDINQPGGQVRSKKVYYWSLHSTAGLKSISMGEIKVYPNPFEDYTTIEFPADITRIDILDTQGRIVRTYEDFNDRIMVIYKRNLMPALYFVKLYGDHIYTTRIVIR